VGIIKRINCAQLKKIYYQVGGAKFRNAFFFGLVPLSDSKSLPPLNYAKSFKCVASEKSFANISPPT